MSNVIEHLFCAYCKQECKSFEDNRNFCSRCTDIWSRVEAYNDGYITHLLLEAHNELDELHSDPYIGPLAKEDQEYYDDLCLWAKILEEEDSYRESRKQVCEHCGDEAASSSMDNLCADCYWEEDSRRKQERRSDPKWRFNRIIDFAHTVEGKSEQEAYAQAVSIFQKEGLPIPI